MKIKNVDKFREELYSAIKDVHDNRYLETSLSVIRSGHVAWVEDNGGVKDRNMSKEYAPMKWEVVALYKPMLFTDSGIYMTVDEEGVDFWKSNRVTEENEETYFVHKSWVDFYMYDSKMSFVMAVEKRIIELNA